MTISGAISMPAASDPYLRAAERYRSIEDLLDRLLARFAQSRTLDGAPFMRDALLDLCYSLNRLRAVSSGAEWQRVQSVCRRHAVNRLLRKDPFTRWSQDRPRGYPGDPVLLDYIYRVRPTALDLQTLDCFSVRLNSITTAMPVAHAVRRRRDAMTALIDSVAFSHPKPEILCVAAGHCRELVMSRALYAGKLGRFVAFDHDREALDLVLREHAGLPIRAVCKPLKSLLGSDGVIGRFDLIYSAGLYDHLSPGLARLLTMSLASRLKPGGKLVVTNFALGIVERAYLEAVMGLELHYRTTYDLEAATSGLTSELADTVHATQDDSGHVVYLTVQRS